MREILRSRISNLLWFPSISFFTIISMTGIIELGPFWQDFSILGDTRSVQSSSFFDGHDWEIQAWDFRSRYSTQNSVDDRNITSRGPVAVWQRLTEQGWELMFWSALEQTEFQITTNIVDDVDPKTDGRYLVWRSQADGVWRVMFMDLEKPELAAEQLSFVGSVDAVGIRDGVVAWQEWIDDSWEIMVRHPTFGAQRVTDNRTADANPQPYGRYVYWEGEDENGGDREIYRFDLLYGTTQAVTENEIDDDAPETYGGEIQWYERRDGISAKMVLDEMTGRSRIIKLIPGPLPLVPEQTTELPIIVEEPEEPAEEAEEPEEEVTEPEEPAEEAEEPAEEVTEPESSPIQEEPTP